MIFIYWVLFLFVKLFFIEIIDRLFMVICNLNLEFNVDVECFVVYNGVIGDLFFKSFMFGVRRVLR